MGRRPPPINKPSKRLIALNWYGGKFAQLQWLLPMLPQCHHYCEPFAGSFAVLLNRAPSAVETANDLDSDVITFFRVLRDDGDRLVEALRLTPFSREEFQQSLAIDPTLPDLERARRFFVRARQVRSGLAQVATLGP